MRQKIKEILEENYRTDGFDLGKATEEILNLFSVSNSKAELCRCLDYEGNAEDGTCYYCRKKLRDDYPA